MTRVSEVGNRASGRPPLRVCIDARLSSGRVGEVEQLVIGLASGLRATGGPDEEFAFHSNPRIESVSFEGRDTRVSEAFHTGLPAACADTPSPREKVGDAALLFDPIRPEEIAAALRRLWTDEGLRSELIARGRLRLGLYRWKEVARNFRARYRRLAGCPLLGDEAETARSTRLRA